MGTARFEFAQIVDAVCEKRGGLRVVAQIGVDRRFLDLQIDAEYFGDDTIIGARFDDLGTGGTEDLIVGLRIAVEAEQEAAEIGGENGLLEEVTAADQIQCFASTQAVGQVAVAAVGGQAAQERPGTVDMAGTDDGLGHSSGIPVEQLEFAAAFIAAVPRLSIVIALFGLGELALCRIENKVGGNENQMRGAFAE